jgi:4-amino-4-deoxy-L-arabinose transferase-like glycosyltransferase
MRFPDLAKTMQKLELKHLLLFLLAARVAQIALILSFSKSVPDEEFYDDIARNMLAGHGYVIHPGDAPSLYRPPLYPIFLTGMFGVFGDSYSPVLAVQLLFDLLTAVVVYRMARDVLGHTTACAAIFLYALYPFFSYYTVRLLTESAFTMLLMAGLYWFHKGLQCKSRSFFIAAGVSLGLGILCRFSLFYVTPLLILVAVVTHRKERAVWVNSLVCGFSILLIIAPWTYRNYIVTGRVVLLGTGSGYNLWLGNHVPTDGRDNDELQGRDLAVLKEDIGKIIGPEREVFSLDSDKRFSGAAIHDFKANPCGTAIVVAKKGFRFWFDVFTPDNRKVMIVLVPIQLILLVLAGIGCCRSLRNLAAVWPLLLVIPYFNAIHAVTVSTFRYCIPVMPLVMIFAAHAIVEWRLRIAGHSTRPASVSP